MAKKPILELKKYFEAGKRPTESQFGDLIDSYVHLDSFNPNGYLPLTGGTVKGTITIGNASNWVITKDLSTITTASGFARDIFRLTGTNGTIDVFGWQGNVDATGTITFGYGYLGGANYNVKNALRWNSAMQVVIGASAQVLPTAGYALDIIGNEYVRGDVVFAGNLNTYQGELAIQRQGVPRVRTNTASTIISAENIGSGGRIFLRPQGDSVNEGQVIINPTNIQYLDAYHLLFGTQTGAGSSIFHTNISGTNIGYGIWMSHNLQFSGTDFIQPRGSIGSWAFTVNYHKGFSFNRANASGTNGSIVSLIELVKISSTGVISTMSTGSSDQWNTAFGWGNHAGKYFSVDYNNPINSLTYQNDILMMPLGTYAATVGTTAANLPFTQVGGVISFGNTSVSTRILGARDNSDNLWFQSGNGSGAWRQLASREWVLAQLTTKTSEVTTREAIDNVSISSQLKENGSSVKREYKIPSDLYLELADDKAFITIIGSQPSDMTCNILQMYQEQEIMILNLSSSSVITVQVNGRVLALVESLKQFKIYVTTDLQLINLGKSEITILI